MDPPRAPGGPSLGFVGGASSVVRGLRFLARTPASWPFAAIPAVLLLVLFAAGAALALNTLAPAIASSFPLAESWSGSMGLRILRFILSAALVVAAALVAAWLTPALSGPALERIVLLRERELGVPERAPISIFTEFWCGLRAQLLGMVVGAPAMAVLWLITVVAPPLAVITVPLKFLVVSLLVAWSLLDYPLSLRGVPLRRRLALLASGGSAVVGFSAVVTLLFAIPLGAVVLLPAGVAAAAEIVAGLERPTPRPAAA